jgi:hypothetical protein
MRKIVGISLLWICMTGSVWGASWGDVNGDGSIGIPEAIYALQMSSGIRPLGGTQRYDMVEYFMSPGTYEYRQKNYGTNMSPFVSQGISIVSRETLGGKEYLVANNGLDYYLIQSTGLLYSGYKSSPTSEIKWFPSPILVGSRSMASGDVFTNFYEDPAGTLLYRDYTFLGIEDVTVPAGTFVGCLKYLLRVQTSASIQTQVQYYAPGVGMVKRTRLQTSYGTSWNGYTNELVSARIGTTSIGVAPFGSSGWWDLYVPAVQAQKVDAYFMRSSGSAISGVNLLNTPISGTIAGTAVNMTTPAGDSFTGTLNGSTMTGTYIKQGMGAFSATFSESAFHFTNFSPGDSLGAVGTQFVWTPGAGAEKYYIQISRDNAQNNCHESATCTNVWSMDGITGYGVLFNQNGTAQETLIPGNHYRVRVYSRYNSQAGIPVYNDANTFIDTTMDVSFIAGN